MDNPNECFVCAEVYNKSYRSKITCTQYNDSKQKCNFSACRKCIRRYILTSGSTAHCMCCKKNFDRDFMIENLCRSWVDNEYETYVVNLLLDTEKARCPENMREAANYKKIPILRKENIDMQKKKRELYEMILNIDNQITHNRNLIYQYRHFRLTNYEKKKKKKFIRKCPMQDCKGYLSQQWKCELCNTNICKDCMDPILDIKTHTCDEDKKKTMVLLKKDTKPCPKCGEMIMKIDTGQVFKNGNIRYKAMDKPQRKKWAIQEAIRILQLRKAEDLMIKHKKKDDLADTLLQTQAFKILYFCGKD